MIRKLVSSCAISVAVVGLIFLAVLETKAAVTYRIVARSGDPAPGTGVGVVFGTIASAPAFNNAGQVAFRSSVTGPGVDTMNITGIWSGGPGSLELVARAGNAAPGTTPDTVFFRFFTPTINDVGQTAFSGSITGPSVGRTDSTGLWSEGPGTLSLVARGGGAAPDTEAGTTFSLFSFNGLSFNPVLNNAGLTAFSASLTGTNIDNTNRNGIWSEGSGSLRLVAREGDAAPGTVPSVIYGSNVFGFSDPAFNNAGQTAFLGHLSGTGVDSTNNEGIWFGEPGSSSLLVRSGDAVPGGAPGEVYEVLGAPLLNDTGKIAFSGSIKTSGVFISSDSGIWSGGAGALSLVARAGDNAPGMATDVIYNRFTGLDFNNAGQTAFVGFLSGPGVSQNSSGIWSEGSGSLGLIARENIAAPGTTPGVRYSSFNSVKPVLNDAGQIAFLGFLTGTGVDDTNNVGVWATDLDGLLTLIVRTGDLFDVNDNPQIDDLRTISSIDLVSGGFSLLRPISFNNVGQLAFRLGFTDGTSGVFVATVPEPTSLAIITMAAFSALRRYRIQL